MKILAVIPARAGSRGVPNKNIRILAGKPMVYYAIHNAKESKFISEVVVTTDSPDVEIIAKQMGVSVKKRDKRLCADDVTLDAVIYDAIPRGEKWDYIVTMQPTSPTLTGKTLDSAIEYAIDQDLDTVISAINAPHLSWRQEKGKVVPNYKKRLNRQYLPPCYMETGAFVISKCSVVSESSRIGEKVSVFEISENEAVDVDNFNDLQTVSHILSQPKVGIYVNGNNQRGMGHISRTLEIADEFFVKPDIYYDINQTDISVFGETKHNLIAVNGLFDLFAECKRNQYTLFINDILTTTIDYMIGLRSVLPKAKIVNFEDDGEGIAKADLVINALFEKSQFKNVMSGPDFYVSGKQFLFYKPIKISSSVKKVLVTFGGSDPQNYTDRILNLISQNGYSGYEFTVVIGKSKKNADRLLAYNDRPNVKVIQNIRNMAEIMSNCDMAITSRGRTGYELASLGIPTISIAQNAREETHTFMCNENGFTYIGMNPDDEIIKANLDMYLNLSQKSRQRFQDLMLSHDLRHGRKRVMSLINNL